MGRGVVGRRRPMNHSAFPAAEPLLGHRPDLPPRALLLESWSSGRAMALSVLSSHSSYVRLPTALVLAAFGSARLTPCRLEVVAW